jgi:cobalt-zinc-cadmium efflux system membrane fusion protein
VTASGRRSRGWAAVAGAGALAALVGAGALGWRVAHPAEAATADGDTRRDVPHLEGALIRFSAAFGRRAGIKIAPATATELSPLLTVTGTVTFDPQLMAAVGARISGRVRQVRRFEGDEVRAGEPLAEIESAELGQAQALLISAHAHAEAATANENRERQLADARVSSEREAEQARATAAAARADLFAAEQRVRALGGLPDGEVGILILKSPIAGKVVEAKVSRGQSVEPTTTLFRIADLHRLWVELAVFERELASIAAGDAVEISPQTSATTVVAGQVARVGDVIDLDTRSADVRIVVDNRDGSLRPGQSVLARVHTARAVAPALVVPREAVVSVDGHPLVFVAPDDTSVEPRTVTLGARDSTRVEIASGLAPGDRIVVEGVFALKSELFR